MKGRSTKSVHKYGTNSNGIKKKIFGKLRSKTNVPRDSELKMVFRVTLNDDTKARIRFAIRSIYFRRIDYIRKYILRTYSNTYFMSFANI